MNPRVAMVMRAFRVSLDLWERANAVATFRGESLSQVIRAALVAYVKKHGKEVAMTAPTSPGSGSDQ